jgi:hypothetical protein
MSTFQSPHLLSALSLLLAATGCVHMGDAMQVRLDWRPTDARLDVTADELAAFNGQSVTIEPGTDQLEGNEIGQNIENKDLPRPVTTDDHVGEFVARHFEQALKASSVKVVPSGGTRVMTINVTKFFVDEEQTYRSHVSLTVTLKDGSGATLWSGTVLGESHNHGSSYNADAYLQSLSDGTLAAASQLLRNPEFQAGLRGKPQ